MNLFNKKLLIFSAILLAGGALSDINAAAVAKDQEKEKKDKQVVALRGASAGHGDGQQLAVMPTQGTGQLAVLPDGQTMQKLYESQRLDGRQLNFDLFSRIFSQGSNQASSNIAVILGTKIQGQIGLHEGFIQDLSAEIERLRTQMEALQKQSSSTIGGYQEKIKGVDKQIADIDKALKALNKEFQEVKVAAATDKAMQEQANKHFASGLIPIIGGLKDVRDQITGLIGTVAGHDTAIKCQEERLKKMEQTYAESLQKMGMLQGTLDKMKLSSLALWVREKVEHVAAYYHDHSAAVFQLSCVGYVATSMVISFTDRMRILRLVPGVSIIEGLNSVFQANLMYSMVNLGVKAVQKFESMNNAVSKFYKDYKYIIVPAGTIATLYVLSKKYPEAAGKVYGYIKNLRLGNVGFSFNLGNLNLS